MRAHVYHHLAYRPRGGGIAAAVLLGLAVVYHPGPVVLAGLLAAAVWATYHSAVRHRESWNMRTTSTTFHPQSGGPFLRTFEVASRQMAS